MMKVPGCDKGRSAAKFLRNLFISWYGLAALAIVLVAAGVVGYWYREELASGIGSGRDTAFTTLGLGLVPVALWLGVFTWALAAKRTWFRMVNLWIGSLAFVAFVLGVLSFFQPRVGVLAQVTLNGDVTLGGDIGYAIAGPVVWQGAIRVSALLLLAGAVSAPRLALDLAVWSGRLLVYVYVLFVVAVKGLVSGLGRMYRFEPRSRFKEGEGPGDSASADGSSQVPSSDADRSAGDMPVSRRVVVDTEKLAELSDPPRRAPAMLTAGLESAEPDAEVETERDDWESSDRYLEPDTADETAPETPQRAGARYNRLWTGVDDGVQQALDLSDQPELEVGGVDGDVASGAPIVPAATDMWKLPPISLLADTTEGGISDQEKAETAETIKRTLAEYGIEVEMGQVMPGPTVTMYGLIPGWIRRQKQVKVTDEHGKPKLDDSGKPIVTRVETKTRVKVDSILSRDKDLSLALKTPSIRMETPVMGESMLGIEVPNPSPTLVTLRGVMESNQFKGLRESAKLPIAIGTSSSGTTLVVDLADMPHLLIAGATGSGKSVCINTIVSCLIMEKTPAEVRLLLVDPKRVELTPYNGIPHLLTPVVVETDQVVSLLKGVIREMLQRYRRMEEVGVRNIDAYNRKTTDRMPYLVVAVDELADLMMSASFDVEQSLCRLAQLGRATGIHLIVATQRPSVDVITGLIKANFPSRISFGVTSQIDSRTILDATGAERLLGRGDMLYLAVDGARPERIQGVFISDREIEDVVRYWQTTPKAPLAQVSLHTVGDSDTDEDELEDAGDLGSRDELLDNAVELAHRYNKLSTSLLQRRLRIGYPRAARLMDQLEEEGIVGPSDGSKSRDVIMSST